MTPGGRSALIESGKRRRQRTLQGDAGQIVEMEELRRESLLADLRQRIRDVRQGPDGSST